MELSGQELKTTMIHVLRALTEKVGSTQCKQSWKSKERTKKKC